MKYKNNLEVGDHFLHQIKADPEVSPAIAAMKTLMESLQRDDSTTLQEFVDKMRNAREELSQTDVSVVSISSGCELFMRFITLAERELEQTQDFASCKAILIKRGEAFVKTMEESRKKIVLNCQNLIKDGMVILTHSLSRNVLAAMEAAAQKGIQFHVYVTEAQPDKTGRQMAEELKAIGVSCAVILDAAVGYIMEKVHAVLMGAEGVCENGGIINKIGSSAIAGLAQMKNKPVYVLVESFKFLRTIPLNNSSLPNNYLYRASVLKSGKNLADEHPLVDYTHPEHITLLYTDLGVLPTSAVTEHLIKLYT